MSASNDHPLNIQSDDFLKQMQYLLTESGFTSPKATEGIKLLGGGHTSSGLIRKANHMMPSLKVAGIPENLETLLRLFIFGARVDHELAVNAFSPMSLDDWVSTGLISISDEGVRAELQLLFYRGKAFTVDFKSDDTAKNHVIGVTAATQTLEMLTVRRNVGSTLDIGTGTGIQAMIAASHSQRVVATDINARAVNVTVFNAWLNSIKIDCLVGDRFEPVGDEKFDLIISCPPFVISPDDRFQYLDSGHPGDQFLEKLTVEGTAHLKEDGFLQVMCQVVQYGEELWHERVQSWLKDKGCDAWMLYRDTVSPLEHARKWVSEREGEPEKVIEEWVEYYEKSGITSITSGLLTVRKNSTGENWFDVDKIVQAKGYCGPSIEAGFRARDFLSYVTDDSALLEALLVFSSEVETSQSALAGEGKSNTSVIQLPSGFLFSETVDERTRIFLSNCNGEETVEEVIALVEETIGSVVDSKEFLNEIRNLIEQGFLLPA